VTRATEPLTFMIDLSNKWKCWKDVSAVAFPSD
jgi:hypothetical protein